MINQLHGSNSIFDVVVIGAGWAGLGAAQTLKQHGIDNLLVVEARDYIGGRSITSHHFGPDNPVDLGSSWIHGVHRNPIQDLAKRHNVPFAHAEGEWKDTAAWYEGKPITSEKRREMKKLRQQFMKYMRRRQKNNDPDTSLESVVVDYCRAKEIELGSDEDQALRWMLDAEIVQEYAAELNELSLKYWDIDDELSGDDSYLAVGNGGGYTSVVESYAKDIKEKIRLRTKVKKVDYFDGDCVALNCADTSTGEECGTIRARCAIITLPLGVLQAGNVTFVPDLPKSKREAIQALGNGLMNKVALYFEGMEESDIFWPRNKEWILQLTPNDAGSDLITEFYNPGCFDSKQRVLIGFIIGEAARRMEELKEEQIADRAIQSLQSIFGKDVVPPPSKVLVTKWEADEYSRGSYSFQKVGSHEHSRRDLAKPVSHRLFFAGEATDQKFPATTHGALLSGKRAGRAVASQLKSLSPK